jgi:stage IV sporulation protein FB
MSDFDFYPEKPELQEKERPKGNIAMTIFSIVLFVLTFLLVFTNEVSFVFYLLIVITVHELGHFSMMKLFNYQHVRMLFVPLMGAFVQGKKDEYSQRQSLLVVGAGPFPGVIAGSALIFIASYSRQAWMIDLGLLFLFLNLLNLVPLDPLDGGQLFKLFLKKKQDLFLLIFSLVSSLLIIAVGFFTDSWLMMIFGFFMGFRVRSIDRLYRIRDELNEESVNYNTTYKLLSNRDFTKIKEVLLNQSKALRTYVDAVSPEESDSLLANQVNSVLVTPVKRDASLFFKSVVLLVWLASIILPFVLLVVYNESIRENYGWYFKLLSNQ